MSQVTWTELFNAERKFLDLCKQYEFCFKNYMLKYDGDEELVKSLLFSVEQAKADAELEWLEKFFQYRDNKLEIYRALYALILPDFDEFAPLPTMLGTDYGKEGNND